jgi:purine-binding chemotaxis protein CheW
VGELSLVFRSAGHVCAVGLSDVAEVMRPLPVTALAGAPPFVAGVSIIREKPTPVVSLAALLDDADGADGADGAGGAGGAGGVADADNGGGSGRFVTAWEGGRQVAFAVDEVLGVRRLPPAAQERTSPLLGALSRDVIPVMAALDTRPLCLLGHVRLVPDSVWAAVDGDRSG